MDKINSEIEYSGGKMKKSLLIILAVLSINLYGETVYRAAVKDLKMEELAGTYSTEK